MSARKREPSLRTASHSSSRRMVRSPRSLICANADTPASAMSPPIGKKKRKASSEACIAAPSAMAISEVMVTDTVWTLPVTLARCAG